MVKELNEPVESSFYDEETLKFVIEKSASKEIRVSLGKRRNNEYVNIREYYQDDEGEWRPGKQGIVMNAELIEEFSEIFNILKEE